MLKEAMATVKNALTPRGRGRPAGSKNKLPAEKQLLSGTFMSRKITQDFETTVLSDYQQKLIDERKAKKTDFHLFAYTAQICLRAIHKDEEGKIIGSDFYVHVWLDERIPRRLTLDEHGVWFGKCGTYKYPVMIHLVPPKENGESNVVCAMTEWLEDFFLNVKADEGGSNANRGYISWEAYSFNAGFEESYTILDALTMGYEGGIVNPRKMGGILKSPFTRDKIFTAADGKDYVRHFKFTLKESSGLWGAGIKLTTLYKMRGLGAKDKTPIVCWDKKHGFFHKKSGEPLIIDDDFMSYAAKDAIGLMMCLIAKWIENGTEDRMTASSATLLKHSRWFINGEDFNEYGGGNHGEQEYEKYFKGASVEADNWLRPHTLGGYNYVHDYNLNVYMPPDYKYVRWLGIDRTNAYLSCMVLGTFPYGIGIPFKGEYEDQPEEMRKDYPFYFQKIRINYAFITAKHMPLLQWNFGTAENVFCINDKNSERERIFILTREELKLFRETYKKANGEPADIEYVDGYMYKEVPGEFLFGGYLRYRFYKRKQVKERLKQLEELMKKGSNSAMEQEKLELTALSDCLKLDGNGLFGKFFENPLRDYKQWFLKDGHVFFDKWKEQDIEDIAPTHIGSQILRMQRMALVKACNAVLKAGGHIQQCDTDAFLCGIPPVMVKQYPELGDKSGKTAAKCLCRIAGIEYGEDLGQWHIEKDAKEGITLEKKAYMWSHSALTDKQKQTPIAVLKRYGRRFNERLKAQGKDAVIIYDGTRGVKKTDAEAQLTPNTWRSGALVRTSQFPYLAEHCKGQVMIEKVLTGDADPFADAYENPEDYRSDDDEYSE